MIPESKEALIKPFDYVPVANIIIQALQNHFKIQSEPTEKEVLIMIAALESVKETILEISGFNVRHIYTSND